MKKPDEIKLYNGLRFLSLPDGQRVKGLLGLWDMPWKRAEYLFLKWTRCGWWNYGVHWSGGWFTDSAPLELL